MTAEAWAEVLRGAVEHAVERGLADGTLSKRAKFLGWSPPLIGMTNAELCHVLRRSMKSARERGLIMEIETGVVLRDGTGERL